MSFANIDDPLQDEMLAKELALLKSVGSAPHALSPAGRRLYEAAARHQARMAGQPVPLPVAPGPGPAVAQVHAQRRSLDQSKVAPGEALQKSVEGLAENDPVRRAIEGQAETVRRLASRSEQMAKDMATLDEQAARRQALDQLANGVREAVAGPVAKSVDDQTVGEAGPLRLVIKQLPDTGPRSRR